MRVNLKILGIIFTLAVILGLIQTWFTLFSDETFFKLSFSLVTIFLLLGTWISTKLMFENNDKDELQK